MGRAVILNEKMNNAATCGIAIGTSGEDNGACPRSGRSATPWIAAAMLATTWASETQASPDQARDLADAHHTMAARNFDSDGTAGDGDFDALPPSGSNDKSVQVAQATTATASSSGTGTPLGGDTVLRTHQCKARYRVAATSRAGARSVRAAGAGSCGGAA